MVTQKNPDENVNHLPSIVVQYTPDAAGDSADANTRSLILFLSSFVYYYYSFRFIFVFYIAWFVFIRFETF